MLILIAGLLIFLGIHSLRMVAPQLRETWIRKLGDGTWKLLYSGASLIGLGLIITGYGISRTDPVFIYNAPLWTRHMALLFTWMAFVLLAAGFVPDNHLRPRLGHPMFAGIKIWAFAHLLANGRLGDIVLFGAFLIWAVAGFAIRRRQDRLAGLVKASGTATGTVLTVVAGSGVWAVSALWLHQWLTGVYPLPF